MKIMSIDPAGNGVTAAIVVNYDHSLEEPIQWLHFKQFDFRAKDITNGDYVKEIRYIQTENLIKYIDEIKPVCVILENFIIFREQVAGKGQPIPTSELIGVLDVELRRRKIPVVKPRSSELYIYDGYGRRQFKYEVTNDALKSRNLIIKGKNGGLAIEINRNIYRLIDYKIGAKSDHIIMALRHVINETELVSPDLFNKIERIKHNRFEKDYTEM